jgi:hypothetical protein
MAQGYFRGKIVCAAARLGIADALAECPQDVHELAAATASNPDALRRLLRALAAIGIVDEIAVGRFALSALGKPLQKSAPDSAWASVVFWADLIADRWTYLADCVRAGGMAAADAELARRGVKSRWSLEPDAPAIFHAVFAEPTARDMATLAAAYDFSRSRCVADLGGAGGALLAAILAAHPHVRGMLVDRKEAIDRAAPRLAAAGLTAQCALAAADLLERVPAGADLYIMKSVLHGYADDQARRILGNCRSSMMPDGRLLLIELVLPDRIECPDPTVERLLQSDLNMLAVTGGRERSETEWRSLLDSAGFHCRRLIPVSGQDALIIEAISPRP